MIDSHGGVRFLAVAATLAAALSCASSEKAPDLELAVDDDEIRVAVSEAAARGVMQGLLGGELECGGELDGELEALLVALDRRGPRARGSYRDGDTTVSARRRGGTLDVEIRSAGSGAIGASMPWAVAECLIGRSTTIEAALSSPITVTVDNPGGRGFSFRMR